mgnify:CR=1 FL=1
MPNIPVLILMRQQFSFNFKRPLKPLPKLKAWLKEVYSLYICGHYQCKNVFWHQKNIDNFLVCVHINFISIFIGNDSFFRDKIFFSPCSVIGKKAN